MGPGQTEQQLDDAAEALDKLGGALRQLRRRRAPRDAIATLERLKENLAAAINDHDGARAEELAQTARAQISFPNSLAPAPTAPGAASIGPAAPHVAVDTEAGEPCPAPATVAGDAGLPAEVPAPGDPPVAGPDLTEASRFIAALIRGDQPGEHYTYQTFDDSEAKRLELARIFHGRGSAAALAKLNSEGAGVFITISATDGKGRREANIKRARAVFADADKEGAAVLASVRAAKLAPHIVVESSPGKYHLYWLVDRAFPMEKFAAVQGALARKFGTDPKVKDLPRVMRLPGFDHMKDPARPFQVRIIELHGELAPYSLERVGTALDLELDESPAPKPAPDRGKDVIDPDTERARRECEIVLAETPNAAEGERNDRLLKFIYALRERAGAPTELCFEFGLRFASEKCSPEYDERQARATVRSAIRSARNPAGSRSEIEEVQHAAIAQEFDVLPKEAADEARRVVIEYVDFGSLARGAPPAREWVVYEWLPRGAVTALFGPGGIGKSLLAQQAAVSVSNGDPWLSLKTSSGPVLGFFCEDDEPELLRRMARILSLGYDDPVAATRRIRLDARAGKPNALMTFGLNRIGKETALFARLREQCEIVSPGLVILDNIAQLFAGQENDRTQVTQFCNALTALAREFNCAVLLLGHPAKAQGSEYSGSTAWEAAVRSRLFMERQDDGTVLLKKVKANYAGLAEIQLVYAGSGVFAPYAESDAGPAAIVEAKEAVLQALDTFTRRRVSTSNAPTARNNLVRLMEQEGLLAGVSAAVARRALGSLLDTGELSPDEPLGWQDSGRHAVRGLRRSSCAPVQNDSAASGAQKRKSGPVCGEAVARHMDSVSEEAPRRRARRAARHSPVRGDARRAAGLKSKSAPEVARKTTDGEMEDLRGLV